MQLTRRAELVPNLVEVVKGYQVHEQATLEAVTRARAAARAAEGPAEAGEAERVLSGSVGSLLAVSEAYPELKADESFLQLQTELATLEEDISFARRYYNAVVRRFNTTQQTFPIVLLARPWVSAKPSTSKPTSTRRRFRVRGFRAWAAAGVVAAGGVDSGRTSRGAARRAHQFV